MIVKGLIVPGIPHPLLCPEANEGWGRLREGFEQARQQIIDSGAERLLIYSTMWPSVIGHQIQADPEPEWVHVDELFHDLGSIPYKFRIDAEFGHRFCEAAKARGLQARTVAYHGFPIDTGSVVALKLLNPDNRIPASIVSSNVYADRAETVVMAKAAQDAIAEDGKKTAVVVVMTLSNRSSLNSLSRKMTASTCRKTRSGTRSYRVLSEGRLEDVAQLSRTIQDQIRPQGGQLQANVVAECGDGSAQQLRRQSPRVCAPVWDGRCCRELDASQAAQEPGVRRRKRRALSG